MKKVAVVYQVLAHYREPIFHRLCHESDDIEYTFFSDESNTFNSVEVIDPAKASLPIEKGGLRWHFVKNFYCRNFLWQTSIVKLAFSKEFDCIIYLGDAQYISTWFSCSLARLMGKRTLMWSHGFLRNENGIKGLIRKTFYKLANAMLLYGNRARKIMIDKGFSPDNLYVVYNSLDYDKQIQARDAIDEQQVKDLRGKIFANPELPALFFIGRLIKSKKLNMILQAMHLLAKKRINANLLFIGDGSETDNLRSLAKELDLQDKVVFYGKCHNEQELAPLIMACDICISPGNIGLTAMHSLIYGKSVITSDKFDIQGPEFEAIEPDKTGDFFAGDNIEDLAVKIEKWIKKGNNKELCYKIIDDYYNPCYQVKVINEAVMGQK
ncbi:MAG: glycosyltransferase [Phycisphaerae bacterium]|nr:glycosyltransferase [Phycisphaerae bacterium]